MPVPITIQSSTVDAICWMEEVPGDINLEGQDIPKQAHELVLMRVGFWRRSDKGRTGTHRSSGAVRTFGVQAVLVQSANVARFLNHAERDSVPLARFIMLRRAGDQLEKAAECALRMATVASFTSNVAPHELETALSPMFNNMRQDNAFFNNTKASVGLNQQDNNGSDRYDRVLSEGSRLTIVTFTADVFDWMYYSSKMGDPEGQEASSVCMSSGALVSG